MWPFSTPEQNPTFEGICPDCGKDLDAVQQSCRNKLPVLTCLDCSKTFDYSYNPHFVFHEVQSQRRDCRFSPMKQLLRKAQIKNPRLIRTRYWVVYELANGVIVFYDSANKQYDVQITENHIVTVGNMQCVINFLTENIYLHQLTEND